MKRKFLALLLFVFLLSPILVSAQAPNPCTLRGLQGNADVSTTFPRCVNQIYVWSLGLGALLAMLMIILGGYYLMTSSGNAEQATKGKEYMTSAIIGVVILFCAYLLLHEINPDLVNFNLSGLKDINSCNQVDGKCFTNPESTAPRN